LGAFSCNAVTAKAGLRERAFLGVRGGRRVFEWRDVRRAPEASELEVGGESFGGEDQGFGYVEAVLSGR
jgi:hypothetical protein